MSNEPTQEPDADAPPAEPAATPSDVEEIPVEVDAPAPPAGPEGQIAALEAKLAAAEEAKATAEREKKDNWDKYLRAVADVENGRKRAKRDLDDARADARGKVLKEMLPVVDNLERAVEHASAGGPADSQAILDGVKLVLRQFQQAFERLDVHAVDAMGQAFDPNLHEAISQQETAEFPVGTVCQVLQRGYRSGERLLRPAMVVVAKAPAAPAPAPEGGDAADSAEPTS
ncbi:MAG: nucleotide exchange factor GrpE [Kofleriaceae bacterium]